MKRRILRSREFLDAGFPLYVFECEQKIVSEHAHDFYEMVYIRRGRGTHLLEGVPYPIRAGDFYFLRPGETHCYLPHENTSLRLINVLWQPSLVREILRTSFSGVENEAVFSEIESFLRPRPKSNGRKKNTEKFRRRLHLEGGAAFRVENLLDEMSREIKAAREGAPAPGCHVLLRHLFCALLVLLARAGQSTERCLAISNVDANDSSQNIVASAIAYLEKNYAQAISVSDVASHVALSSGRFAHVFKKHTGRGTIEYLSELRMEKALAALRESLVPIGEIAASCGYNDTRFFHRVFRRYAGCNPSEYRRQFSQASGSQASGSHHSP